MDRPSRLTRFEYVFLTLALILSGAITYLIFFTSIQIESNCGIVPKQGFNPWLVQSFSQRGAKQFNCGGSFISNQHVITAAHCVVTNNTRNTRYHVYFNAQFYEASLVSVAPNYGGKEKCIMEGKTDHLDRIDSTAELVDTRNTIRCLQQTGQFIFQTRSFFMIQTSFSSNIQLLL